MDDDLGVRLGGEGIALLREFTPQIPPVFNDSVVHDGDASAAVEMGMGIVFERRAVRRPAGVSDPRGARYFGTSLTFFEEPGEFPLCPTAHDPTPVREDGDPGGVIPPVGEPTEPLEQERRRGAHARITDNAAHISVCPPL